MSVQKRNIAVCIILTIITCGIYGLYWIAVVNDELNYMSGRQGATSGGMVVLFSIITCGIYEYYWMYKMGEIVEELRQRRGLPGGSSPIVYLLLSIFGLSIVSMGLMQNELNEAIGG